MAQELDATGLIAFLLWRKRGKNLEVNFEEIRNLKFKIEKKFPKYHITTDRDTVFSEVGANSLLLKWNNHDSITRAEGSGELFKEKYMNYFLKIQLPEEVVDFMRKECVPKSATKKTLATGKESGLSGFDEFRKRKKEIEKFNSVPLKEQSLERLITSLQTESTGLGMLCQKATAYNLEPDFHIIPIGGAKSTEKLPDKLKEQINSANDEILAIRAEIFRRLKIKIQKQIA